MADKAIVDKAISDLTQALQITNEDLFVLEQGGEAKKLKGSQVVQYAKDSVAAEVQGVKEYADSAKASADAAAASAEKAAGAAQGIDDKVAAADASAKAAASSAAAAAASATGVDEKVQAAQTAATNAAKSETAAKNAQTAAANAQKAAESAQTGAQNAKTAAESAQEAAESAKNAAAGSSTDAGQKATQAAQSAEDAASAKSAAETAKTDAQAARDAIVNMIVEAVTLETGKPATVSKSLVDNVYKLVFGLPRGGTGAPGPKGAPGNGISGIALKSGTHAPGTSDVYTITLTDGTTFDFAVYNGANGQGAGDMLASVYDPQGKHQDVFKYVDDGLAKKQGVSDEIQGLRLRGGILSAGYSGKSVAINPAINGLGFALYRGATVRAFYDSYEMEVGNDTINNLFDGKYGSYVNFVTGVGGSYTWDASKKYPAGAYVRVYRNSRYEWYKATEENIGVNPSTDASGVWINKNAAETGTYASFLDITGVSVSLEFTFPQNVNLRYENGVALYWRASGQNASHVKVEKYDETVGWFAVFDKDVGPDDIITNIYLGQNAPGVTSSVQNKIRFTFRFRDAQKWCCLNQIAFSGIVGGIEGTLLNRGGGTMYGDISPYMAGRASLGSASAPWREIRGQYFYGDLSTAFTKFSLATSRELLTTGETLTKAFGKIQKWLSDLGALAFKSKVAKADLDDTVKSALVPSTTSADNGKFLRVVNGKWAASEISNANGGSF